MAEDMRLDRPPLLVELIIEKLQEAIIGGSLPPGSRLTEEGLSQRLNASRTPIREALIKLELLGYVQRRPAGGWDVSPLDVERTLQRYEIKTMIEAYAVLRSTSASRETFMVRARPILAEMRRAARTGDYDAYRDLDLEFHNSLVGMHEKQFIAEMYAESVNHVRWIRKMAISPFLQMKDSLADHTRIVEALAAHDVVRAVDELVAHLERLLAKVRQDIMRKQEQLLVGSLDKEN